MNYQRTNDKDFSYLRRRSVNIPSSRRPHFVSAISTFLIFLIMVALAVEMIGCGGRSVDKYNLIVSSTAGGSVTTPTDGTFTYDTGTVVNLVATPATGYRFVNWTGDVGTITNVNAASTTVTMNDSYSITANFEPIPAGQYSLTISSTTEGWLICGNVTTPGEGMFIYSSGTVSTWWLKLRKAANLSTGLAMWARLPMSTQLQLPSP